MPNDFIRREAAIGALKEETRNPYVVHGPQAYGAGIYGAQKIIERLPAADVAPVVHGEWGADGKCTHCSSPMPVKDCTGDEMGKNDSQYCFRCGSRMDGGEHHAD